MPSDFAHGSSLNGLSETEAQRRLKLEGYNELPKTERRTPLRIVMEVLREPMLALLLGGGAIYFLLGDIKEALVLIAFATFSVVITVVQETRTKRVLEALRDLTSPRALVIRDGKRKRIAGREVVRGDVIVVAEGDRVPADAILIAGDDLQADESLLTGESVPVRKIAGDEATVGPNRRLGGNDLPNVYSGSLMVRGSGVALVTATGALSEIGKIGLSLKAVQGEPPRLQVETRRLVRLFAVVGGAVSGAVVLLYGLLRGGWLDAVLAAHARLVAHDYQPIGLDHFALPSDPLAIALRAGKLSRNFQGYTTDGARALIGFGASAISSLPQGYAQNETAVPDYRQSLLRDDLAIARGRALTGEDRFRRDIIERLMCDFYLDLEGAAMRHGRKLASLGRELEKLSTLKAHGLVLIDGPLLLIPDDMRAGVRLVCAVFDAFLEDGQVRHAAAV